MLRPFTKKKIAVRNTHLGRMLRDRWMYRQGSSPGLSTSIFRAAMLLRQPSIWQRVVAGPCSLLWIGWSLANVVWLVASDSSWSRLVRHPERPPGLAAHVQESEFRRRLNAYALRGGQP